MREVRDDAGFASPTRAPQSDSGEEQTRYAWNRHQQRSIPVAIDTPPHNTTVVEQHYVPYQRDDFAKAHAWACEQLVRKSPELVESLTSLDSLIRQQLNASK